MFGAHSLYDRQQSRIPFVNVYVNHCLLIFLILAALATAANSSEVREIELSDGSVISGEILSLSRGIYTIRSDSLGTVRIEETKIRTIRQKSSSGAVSDARARIQSLEDKMTSNDEIASLIRSLQDDPDFMQALQDPEIMRAVQSGDITSLMTNQKFINLLNKQTVQQIKNKTLR